MKTRLVKESGISPMIAWSLLFHAVLFGLIYKFSHFESFHPPEKQAYYVDIVNLPVANPRSGSPAAPEKTASATTSPQKQEQKQEMKLPAPARKKPEPSPTKPALKKTPKEIRPAETDEDFQKRLARLEQKADSRHESTAIDDIRKRLSTGGRAGMPGAKGNQAGSDYASYVQSRLSDAFQETIAFQSSNPQVAIKLRISKYGKVIGYSVVHSTMDKLFEASVSRAISIAGENLPPPPSGSNFEQGFVFRRKGVGKR
ncbi:MAG TPA: TonB C-terminal domain-containing protein [Geobacteraceae bacterium]|nr:TonB C-terminal domain-containing protein [Geobacteraceae bacterium]